MKFVDEFRDAELGQVLAGEILARARARASLQGDGGVRRPHAFDLQVRDRRPAALERRARSRTRLPGVRDSDGPGRRRHRGGQPRGRDLHLLRGHAAGPGLGVHAAGCQGPGRRHADGLLTARRAANRPREPRSRGRVLRHRVRDDCAVDGADAEAGQGRGDDELLLRLQPRDDRPAAASPAGVARSPARRVHRPGPRVHGGRGTAVRVHPGRLRTAGGDLRLRAARRAPVDPDDPSPAGAKAAARWRTSTREWFRERATSVRSR